MKRLLVLGLALGILAPISIGAAVSWGAAQNTGCWDEYNNRGTRFFRTVAPKGLPLADCTPAAGCYWGYDAAGKRNRLYVPHQASPKMNCDLVSTTTVPVSTSTPASDQRFATLAPGSTLPSDAQCAARVRPAVENRPGNATYNSTRGTAPDATYPRVTGNYVGTTDEIIQWTACKWGIDEDWVRAQIVNESNWHQKALGDFTTSPSACAPSFPIGTYPPQWGGDRIHTNECPESIGLGQVRWTYHQSAFASGNAVKSSAYNLDYTYAVWRECFEGRFGWLNDVDGRGDYAAGDAKGCLGTWFSGRWYTDAAIGYIERFDNTLAQRPWAQPSFANATAPTEVVAVVTTTAVPTTAVATTAVPTTAVVTTAVPTTAVPTTAVPTTAVPTTAVATTAVATTAVPTTTPPPPPPAAPATAAFVESFDGNTGLERFNTGMYHRDDFLVAKTSWTGDHDLNCGDPSTQRTIRRDRPNESFYMCREHLMTSVGDTSGYSIAWFSPKQTFHGGTHTQVSFDVNVTNLGNRQWWEVSLVPVGSPYLATVDWVADTANIDSYDDRSVVVGKGPYGNDGNIVTGGTRRDPLGYGHVCGSGAADAEGCGSKAIRRTFTITDNLNGTITFDFLGKRYSYPGAFPKDFEVYFKDHNYTPDKDGVPVGHTWHWDNIVVR